MTIVRTIAPEGMPRPTGEEGHVLLDAVWAYFGEHYRWPTFDDIDRQLFVQGLDIEEVLQQLCPALLLGLSHDISQLPHGHYELSLSVAGAANCTGTGPALAVFLDMVEAAVKLEVAWVPADRDASSPWMRPEDLVPPPGIDPALLTKAITFAAAALAQRESCFRGGSINRENLDWSISFDRTVRPYANAHTVADYWRIRELQGPERAEADRRPFSKQPTTRTEAVLQPWPPAPAAPAGDSPEPMSVTCVLHPLIAEVAAERYDRGAYSDAVRSAIQAVEHRVHVLVGPTRDVGDRLMGVAFSNKPDPPLITVTRSTDGSLESEQNGMQALFKGAVQAIRNPRSHGPDREDNRDEADEMLAFASFLMRRLDIEDAKRAQAADESAT
ncbi:TIGR02391 family protein [Streptomyces sp. NPDC058691]|uniref:TIGR02391 family protein n=1 Tax=Streptomyces sp. NPDC058691 TaxID=3346601 RepID=UPI00364F0F83